MIIKDIIEKLNSDESFKAWKTDDVYMTHIFRMYDKPNEKIWQVGFYNPKTEKVVPIEIDESGIRIGQESPVFNEGKKVLELGMSDVKIDIADALDKAKLLQEEKYADQKPMKVIMILQDLGQGPIYNVTYVTQSFKTLNMRFKADDGSPVSDNLTQIFSFSKGG